MKTRVIYLGLGLWLTGCGSSGHVNFSSGLKPTPETPSQPAGFNMVLGSQALATSSNGYKAKLQLSDISGIKSTASNGYSAKVRFATRTR